MLTSAILAAAVPTVIYSLLLWWLDRYEKEPLSLILIAFFWGAIPAIALAVLFELVLAVPVEQSPLGPNATSWGLAPVIEELLKAAALAGLFVWARNEFDGPLDGIVYGSLVGFGFSMTENLLYFLAYPAAGNLFWVRGVLFGLNHAFFTSMVGLAFGAVRYRSTPLMQAMALLAGLTLAISFHAAHNFLTTSFQTAGLVSSWLVQSSGVLVVLAIAVLTWRHERRWLRDELGEEVHAGIISADDYSDATSSAGRTRRQFQALLHGGLPCYRRTRRLHYLMTELAFCKSKIRLADRFQDCAAVERLRGEISAVRASLGRDQGLPVIQR